MPNQYQQQLPMPNQYQQPQMIGKYQQLLITWQYQQPQMTDKSISTITMTNQYQKPIINKYQQSTSIPQVYKSASPIANQYQNVSSMPPKYNITVNQQFTGTYKSNNSICTSSSISIIFF